MLKRLPSRNQRSKGIRVKHVLQICLLLGICFWLIYQVKHSHDKKKAFDVNGVKTSAPGVTDTEIIKLGRKDLPREDVAKIEKPEEEEEETPVEEEERREEEREEDDNKREGHGEEEEENKNEEAEDGGGGDDEIDENDQERKEEEGNRDEDFVDDDKEQEGNFDDEEKTDNGDIEDQVEKENSNSSEDQDNDGGDQRDHEAREEHYKADDASSEVAHDAQVINTEIKTSLENSNENVETKNAEKSNNTEAVNKNESELRSVVGEGAVAENATSLDVVSSGQKVENSSVDNQILEITKVNDQPETGNSAVQVSTEASNGSSVASSESSNNTTAIVSTKESNNTTAIVSTKESNNTTETQNEVSSKSSQKNSTEESMADAGLAQNAVLDGTTGGGSTGEKTSLLEQTDNSTLNSENNKVDFNSTISTITKNANGASKESSYSSNNTEHDVSEKILKPDETVQVEDGSNSSTAKEDTDATQNERSDNKSDAEGGEEGAGSTSGTEDAIQHDPIDSSDTQIGHEVKDVRTDLDTLPDLRSIRDESEGAAAE